MKKAKSLGLIALRSMISEGRLSVVTAIIKANTVPRSAPFAKRASAIGMLPKYRHT